MYVLHYGLEDDLSQTSILSTVPSALYLVSIFYVGYQLHAYKLSYVTKMQNRMINGMLHRISKFHGKASFYNVTLFYQYKYWYTTKNSFLPRQSRSGLQEWYRYHSLRLNSAFVLYQSLHVHTGWRIKLTKFCFVSICNSMTQENV